MTDDGLTPAQRGMAMLADIHAACATALAMILTPDSGEITVDQERIQRSSLADGNELTVRYTLSDTWGVRMIFNRTSQQLIRASLVNLLTGDHFPVSDDPIR